MNQTLECPVLGLEETFPEELYILKHGASGKYGCYCYDGIHGLACFSTEHGAFSFAEWIDLSRRTIHIPTPTRPSDRHWNMRRHAAPLRALRLTSCNN